MSAAETAGLHRSFFITAAEGEVIPLDCKFSRTIPPDAIASVCTAGSGGYGDLAERDRAFVEANRLDGKVIRLEL